MKENARRLDGQVAIVTGGGSGIGAAIATLFANNGAQVVIAGRTLSLLEGIAEMDGIHAFQCDVTSIEQVSEL
ncbi:MAG: SDR family NAD(P)-dependent oxidoreductase, partial [Cohaesibacteraceae bacterium]|nr:SDR family NAD(P)-dependent oxidoreductase [Cohaesibacteraceae bacterium]MBL4875859.1 SDR family NAD(P)-dependent oxidoreductase [Cohaesibacteraceae bacterium]